MEDCVAIDEPDCIRIAEYIINRCSVRSRNESGTSCHASLKCCHEKGTVKRAWQEKLKIDT